jgi:RNA polymerase sigma-54 factor
VFWQGLTPARNRSLTPDVSLRFEGEKLVAESVEFRSWRLQLEAQYLRLDHAMRVQRSRFSTEDRQHVRLYMGRAKALTDALVQRRRTLERVTLFIGEVQRDFLVDGPEMLKPLTKKQVSQAMGLHESTICRATLHKYVQLPNGEVTSFDTFFDGSLSPKEVIRRIIAQEPPQKPLSDGEIAKRMGMAGFQLARRTIAKYRDALGVPPMELRRRP